MTNWDSNSPDPRRCRARPTTGATGRADLSDDEYVFRDTAHAKALFGLEELGNIYTRIMNPTQAVFEEARGVARRRRRRAGGGEWAGGRDHRATQPAENGGHIVSSASLYGGTYNLSTTRCPSSVSRSRSSTTPTTSKSGARRYGQHQGLLRRDAGNPKGDVLDFEGVSKVAHDNGIPSSWTTHWPRRSWRTHSPTVPTSSCTRDEVHRWPRHVDWWRHRRRRDLRLRGQRSLPVVHRARPELPTD